MNTSVLAHVMSEKLKAAGSEHRVSRSYVKSFVKVLGLSYRKNMQRGEVEIEKALALDMSMNLVHKVVYLTSLHAVTKDRSTALLRRTPQKPELARQRAWELVLSDSDCWQDREGFGASVSSQVSDNHWQSSHSMVKFLQFMDSQLNAASPKKPFVVMDSAPTHTNKEYRALAKAELPWVHHAYVSAGMTSVTGPTCGHIRQHVAKHFAELYIANSEEFESASSLVGRSDNEGTHVAEVVGAEDIECDTEVADEEDDLLLEEQSSDAEFVQAEPPEMEKQATALTQAQRLLALRLTCGRPSAKDLASASSL
eukprot:921150-Amphidinium_carterae.1